MQPHNPFAHILVGVEPRGLAAQALILAFRLVDRLDSRLDLVHAVEIPPPLWPGLTDEKLAEMHAQALNRARSEVSEALRPVLAEAGHAEEPLDQILTVAPGHAGRVLVEKSIELRSDLIILGPHSKRSLFDFGSTTRAVFAHSKVPVWVQAEPPEKVQTILVPIDFSEHSRRALDIAHSLARRMEAELRVMHVHAPPSQAYAGFHDATPGPSFDPGRQRRAAQGELEDLMDKYEWGPVAVGSSFVDGDPVEETLAAARNADLVVMGTHGRTGLTRFLLGGTSYSVLRRCTRPVVVVPHAERKWQMGEDSWVAHRVPVSHA